MELNALAQLEGILLAIVFRRRNFTYAKIAFEICRVTRVGRVNTNQKAIDRCERMNNTECRFTVTVR